MMAEGNRKRLRILHTSDFHLSLLDDSACESLVAVVDFAIRSKVDLVIVAGDLFDYSRVDDKLVSFVAGQLQRLRVPTVILPGNHDCLVPGSVYAREEPWSDCGSVRILREPHGEILDLREPGVAIWGKSNNSDDSDVRPLEGIPQPPGKSQWNIAVAHGYYVGTRPPLFPSYHITKEEIITSGWDYIALGHVPMFRCVCSEPVKAYYCGSPSMSGTVALVDLAEETGVQVTRHLLQEGNNLAMRGRK